MVSGFLGVRLQTQDKSPFAPDMPPIIKKSNGIINFLKDFHTISELFREINWSEQTNIVKMHNAGFLGVCDGTFLVVKLGERLCCNGFKVFCVFAKNKMSAFLGVQGLILRLGEARPCRQFSMMSGFLGVATLYSLSHKRFDKKVLVF